MKKVFIILICILLIACSFLLMSCDSGTNELYAVSIIDWELFQLKIKFSKAHAAGWSTGFSTKLTLEEIKAEVNKKGLTAELYGEDFLLIIKPKVFIGVNYFMVARLGYESTENCYVLMCPSANIADDFEVLFPFHLLGFNSKTKNFGMYYTAVADEAYKINSTYKEIADFYKAVKVHDVVEEPSRILITLNSKLSIQYRDRVNPIATPPEKEPAPIGGTFAIEFAEKEDGTYATYRVISNGQ